MCTGCKRAFCRDEFSKAQLTKGKQVCRMCRLVNEKETVQRNRKDNWARQERYEETDPNQFDDPFDDHGQYVGYAGGDFGYGGDSDY